MRLLVSPHADDETLFAAYVQLRDRPQVVVCMRGRRARHLVANDVREAESRAACRILGTDVEFVPSPCDPPDWQAIEEALTRYDPERVYAPLPEPGGATQHNQIGNLAAALWPDRTWFYATYAEGNGKSVRGRRVVEEDGWQEAKAAALRCYASQASKEDTAFHFDRDQAEYLTSPTMFQAAASKRIEFKLNLGAGPNPLDGFFNLDPTYPDPWRFEDGLGAFGDRTVDAVTVSHALMYLPAEKWPALFAEVKRVLRHGGMFRVTEDNIGGEGSERQKIRPGAAVATTPVLVSDMLETVGLEAEHVTARVSGWHDLSLVQANYGAEPTVFHIEALRA